jgi:hypothetical protein
MQGSTPPVSLQHLIGVHSHWWVAPLQALSGLPADGHGQPMLFPVQALSSTEPHW